MQWYSKIGFIVVLILVGFALSLYVPFWTHYNFNGDPNTWYYFPTAIVETLLLMGGMFCSFFFGALAIQQVFKNRHNRKSDTRKHSLINIDNIRIDDGDGICELVSACYQAYNKEQENVFVVRNPLTQNEYRMYVRMEEQFK